jgi:hypothetical protein
MDVLVAGNFLRAQETLLCQQVKAG